MKNTLKVLLVFPKKVWKNQDNRVKDIQQYLTDPNRLGTIYSNVTVESINIDFPTLTVQPDGFFLESDLKKITEPYRKKYHAVQLVHPFIKNQRFWGGYYPNKTGDYILDAYILCDERTKWNGLSFLEEGTKHEIAGHGASLDLGRLNQGQEVGYDYYKDNTHHYFVTLRDKEAYFKDLNDWSKNNPLWKARKNSIERFIKLVQDKIDSLKKSPK